MLCLHSSKLCSLGLLVWNVRSSSGCKWVRAHWSRVSCLSLSHFAVGFFWSPTAICNQIIPYILCIVPISLYLKEYLYSVWTQTPILPLPSLALWSVQDSIGLAFTSVVAWLLLSLLSSPKMASFFFRIQDDLITSSLIIILEKNEWSLRISLFPVLDHFHFSVIKSNFVP